MNTLKIAPGFTKRHNAPANGNMLALPKTIHEKPVQSVSTVACEVRNPLTIINLSIDMLQSEIKDNYLKTYLDIITRSSMRINDMINEILKLREADQIEPGENPIYQMLDEIIEMANGQVIPENIRIRKDNDAKGSTIEIILHKTAH
jgi:signal transduction histidine kinase